MTEWGWMVASAASGLVGGMLGILLTWASMTDCRKEQWQLRDDLHKTRMQLDKVSNKLDSMIGSPSPKAASRNENGVPDRSEGRSGPKHRTMWGDV